jgi:hypothetical protein
MHSVKNSFGFENPEKKKLLQLKASNKQSVNAVASVNLPKRSKRTIKPNNS